MTCISKKPTKKAFKEEIDSGHIVYATEPRPNGRMIEYALCNGLPNGGLPTDVSGAPRRLFVTNHPRRSWFAQVDWYKHKLQVK